MVSCSPAARERCTAHGLRRSRYERTISPRLDEEIAELKRRLNELQRQRGI
jgi:hypothetical protein